MIKYGGGPGVAIMAHLTIGGVIELGVIRCAVVITLMTTHTVRWQSSKNGSGMTLCTVDSCMASGQREYAVINGCACPCIDGMTIVTGCCEPGSRMVRHRVIIICLVTTHTVTGQSSKYGTGMTLCTVDGCMPAGQCENAVINGCACPCIDGMTIVTGCCEPGSNVIGFCIIKISLVTTYTVTGQASEDTA